MPHEIIRMLSAMSIDTAGPRVRLRTAQWWHGATALVAAASLVTQFILVLNADNDTALTRAVRYFSYVTIQSNIAVCVVCAMLAARPDREGPVFRVARLDAVIGITVTGLGWLVFGPRPRINPRVIWLSVIAPIVWLAYTLVPRPGEG